VRRRARRRHLLAGALLLSLPLTACGGSTGATSTAARRPAAAKTTTVDLGPHPLTGAAARRARVPVLMYHVVNSPPPGTPYPELWTPPATFAAQMRSLQQAGYRGVTLDRVLDAWDGRAALPRHPVVVSFDDGYLSQATEAAPDLKHLGWPGVLNLEVHNVGPKGIPAASVRGLIRDGWEVDSHTISHPDLTTLDAATLRREVTDSRRDIRHRFHVRADAFCYPAGRYDAAVEAAVRAAGYRAATTENPGAAAPGDDRLALPRVRVNGTDSGATVLANVRGA
jgi:peptidoglycan/xylan/chitin deacetylase (PgdA/CDA1 family)